MPEDSMMNEQHGTSGSDSRPSTHLKNDTIVNVAQLLKDDVGSYRLYRFSLDTFELDTDILAKNVEGRFRLTRISRGILASGHVKGLAIVECHRCLELYDQPFESDFDQEYRPLIDVRSGLLVDQPEPGEELGLIDEAHELDLAEPVRQVAILDLPIKLLCGEDCAGMVADLDDEDEPDEMEAVDRRFGALSALLDPDEDSDR